MEIKLTLLKKTQNGWEPDRLIESPIGLLELGIGNRPGSIGLEAMDVRMLREVYDVTGQAYDDTAPFTSGQHLDGLWVDVRSPYDNSDYLTYLFEDCFVTDTEVDGKLERFSVCFARIEWKWTSRNGAEPTALLDMQAGSFKKGTAWIDLLGRSHGRASETAVVTFLKLPGFCGSSIDRDHHGWIELSSFLLHLTHEAAVTARILPNHVVEIERRPDRLSPRLAEACVDARLLSNVALEVVALRSRQVLLSYRLRDCHIAGCRASFKSWDNSETVNDTFFERWEITFKQIEFQYFSSEDGLMPESVHGVGESGFVIPHSRLIPQSAFIIMWMDPNRPELEEVHQTILEVCTSAGITAVRADDIQHSDQITEVVLERIRTSEVIIADLTGERPNVYYEVGHAHAIGKKPILVRRKGCVLHFDLAVHNVIEYGSIDELHAILTKRLGSY